MKHCEQDYENESEGIRNGCGCDDEQRQGPQRKYQMSQRSPCGYRRDGIQQEQIHDKRRRGSEQGHVTQLLPEWHAAGRLREPELRGPDQRRNQSQRKQHERQSGAQRPAPESAALR